MNKVWHQRHKLASGATPKERLAWHLEHQKRCGCRPIPQSLQRLLARPKQSGRGREQSKAKHTT
jgi:hypothetical protein